MQQGSHEKLVSNIEQLRGLLARHPTFGVVAMISLIVRKGSDEAHKNYGLTSPYRQAYYLLGLLLTTPELGPDAATEREMGKEALAECCRLVEIVYQHYFALYFPDKEEVESGLHLTDEWRTPRSVAMPAFLQYFNSTRVMASVEQLEQRIAATCSPFDMELATSIGISASDAVRVVKWISEYLQRKLDAVTEFSREADRTRLEFLSQAEKERWGPNRMRLEAQNHPTKEAHERLLAGINDMFLVKREDLAAGVGTGLANAYWDRFTIRRGEVAPQDFTYPTDHNPTDTRPLIEVTEGAAFTSIGNPLFLAILSAANEALGSDTNTEKALRTRFLKRRDKALEEQVENHLRGFFGPSAKVYTAVFETADSQNEHDVVVVWERRVFIFECKAGAHAEPFRDPVKAYTRLRREFRAESGIQKGVDQAERLRKLVMGAAPSISPIMLYDADGKPMLSLNKEEIDAAYSVCVTADNFGALAVDLAMLLEKEEGAPYPWCVNVLDLEVFLDGLAARNWGPAKFAEFLQQRSLLHGKVTTMDELEVAGIFLLQGSLNFLTKTRADRIFLTPEQARVFDDIYDAKRRGEEVDFSIYPAPKAFDSRALMREALGTSGSGGSMRPLKFDYSHGKSRKAKDKRRKNKKR
jgi:hypothetical protein